MPLHVSSTRAHHHEVKILLYSIWYHETYRWPSGAQVERVLQSSLNLRTGRPSIGPIAPIFGHCQNNPRFINRSTFDVLLTVHLSIFISVINQLEAQNFCFTVSLFHASTCFEHMCSSSRGQNCITQPLVSSHL